MGWNVYINNQLTNVESICLIYSKSCIVHDWVVSCLRFLYIKEWENKSCQRNVGEEIEVSARITWNEYGRSIRVRVVARELKKSECDRLMGRLNLTPVPRVLTWVGNGNKLLTYTSKVICTLHYEFMILWYIYGNVGDWNSNRKVVKYNGKSHFWYTLVSTFNHFLPTPCTACIKRVCNKLFSLPG